MQDCKKQLSDKEIQGLISLLKDSEEQVLNLIAEQITKIDDSSLTVIENLAQESDNPDLIDNWYHTSRLSLTKQIQDWKRAPDLETGLFLLSRLRNPGFDKKYYENLLDQYAARVQEKIQREKKTPIAAINQVLFREEGFTGNHADYYDLNNNFLHTVIDTKAGNPIMLSTLYILIARRLNLEIKGIGTPGHFIVEFEGEYFDAFFRGRTVTKEECVLRAQELGVLWRDEYIEPIDDAFMISRCIRNLIAIYKRQKEFDKAEDATSLLKLV